MKLTVPTALAASAPAGTLLTLTRGRFVVAAEFFKIRDAPIVTPAMTSRTNAITRAIRRAEKPAARDVFVFAVLFEEDGSDCCSRSICSFLLGMLAISLSVVVGPDLHRKVYHAWEYLSRLHKGRRHGAHVEYIRQECADTQAVAGLQDVHAMRFKPRIVDKGTVAAAQVM